MIYIECSDRHGFQSIRSYESESDVLDDLCSTEDNREDVGIALFGGGEEWIHGSDKYEAVDSSMLLRRAQDYIRIAIQMQHNERVTYE